MTSEVRRDRRVCGLKRVIFFILLAIITIAALAIALGVGLSLGLREHASALPSAPSTNLTHPTNHTQGGTGIATATLGSDGDANIYYQLRNGSIVEEILPQDLQSKDLSNPNITSSSTSLVVFENVTGSTPLSASTYTMYGKTMISLFYLDDEYHICTTNRTLQSSWSPPVRITPDPITFESIALTSCFNSAAYGSLNVFYATYPFDSSYGSNNLNGLIQLSLSANTSFTQWAIGQTWVNTVPTSGAACHVSQHINGTTYMHIFSRTAYNISVPAGGPRNPASGRLQHWVQTSIGSTQTGPWRQASEPDHADTEMYIVDGSGMAAGSSVDDINCTVVYYNADGRLRRWNFACFEPDSDLFDPSVVDMPAVKPGPVGLMPGNLEAEDETVLLYQGGDYAMRWSSFGNGTVGSDGKMEVEVVGNGTLPGWQ